MLDGTVAEKGARLMRAVRLITANLSSEKAQDVQG